MEPARLRESLRKQGIYVHESDPVLEVAAICDAAMADTLKAIEGIVKAAADRTSAAASQTVDASKQAGEAIITQGATFLVEQFREAVREVSAAMVAELRQEAAKAERASRAAVRSAWAVGSAGAVALAGLAGFLLAGLGHG
jgi:CHASE3 domain sensor protein